MDLPYLQSWTAWHFNRILADYMASTKREQPIPPRAPLDFTPTVVNP